MRKLFIPAVVIIIASFSCKPKTDEKNEKKYISVRSLIEKQVAHIDTSLYSIMKIVFSDTLHRDTSYIRREDFREAAKEFLEIPDLSDPKVAKNFTEESHYDETMNRVMITYTPIDPKKQEIQKQELLITPNSSEGNGDKVNNIIINRVINNRNGFLQKNMLWLTDKSFQVITTSQLPGEPEKVVTTIVNWNDHDNP